MKITQIELVNGLFNAKIEGATAKELEMMASLDSNPVVTALAGHFKKKEKAPKIAKYVKKTSRKYKTGYNLKCQYPLCGRGFRANRKIAKYHSISCSTKHAYMRGGIADHSQMERLDEAVAVEAAKATPLF